jgi:hypothetical protein
MFIPQGQWACPSSMLEIDHCHVIRAIPDCPDNVGKSSNALETPHLKRCQSLKEVDRHVLCGMGSFRKERKLLALSITQCDTERVCLNFVFVVHKVHISGQIESCRLRLSCAFAEGIFLIRYGKTVVKD